MLVLVGCTTDDSSRAVTIERIPDCLIMRDMKSTRVDTLRVDSPDLLIQDMKVLKIYSSELEALISLKIGHQIRLVYYGAFMSKNKKHLVVDDSISIFPLWIQIIFWVVVVFVAFVVGRTTV